MAAVLNRSETAFQAAVISGPPALGPGAPAHGSAAGLRPGRLDSTFTTAR